MTSTRRRPTVLLIALVTCLGLSACSTGSSAAVTGQGHAAVAALQVPAPAVSITPGNGAATVRLNTPVRVSTAGGTLMTVEFHSVSDPTPLVGQMSDDRSTWTSDALLDPDTGYVVLATARGVNGATTTARSGFRTDSTAGRLTASTIPADGSTVGVGMPVILHFNNPIEPDRQEAVVERLVVHAEPPTVGAWHWFTPYEVHWRPKDYWQSGTKVTVSGDLRDLDAGNDVFGLGQFSFGFTIGDKHVSTIDTVTHQMTVTDNDQVIHTYPISAGRLRNPTLSGVLFVRYRQYDVLMDSESIGIPRYSADGYYEHVYWDTAISTDGFFVHSAPWSEYAQGGSNVSHGCVNLSPARAEEFYQFSQIGDIVQVTGSSRPADASDGEGDWQIPFDQFANSGAGAGAPATAAPTPAGPGGGL